MTLCFKCYKEEDETYKNCEKKGGSFDTCSLCLTTSCGYKKWDRYRTGNVGEVKRTCEKCGLTGLYVREIPEDCENISQPLDK